MDNIRKEVWVISAALVIGAWFIGEGLKTQRYVAVEKFNQPAILDTQTGTLLTKPDVASGLWIPFLRVPK
jgi:hypothetical protein